MKTSLSLSLIGTDEFYLFVRKCFIKLFSNYYLIGMVLLSLYIVQSQLGIKFEALNALQNEFYFKQVSGYLFLVYFLFQWKLSKSRVSSITTHSVSTLRQHKYTGMLAPLFLYLHTTEIGTGYLAILSIILLMTIFTGLLNYENTGIRRKIYMYGWLITHISAATLTLGLIFFHLYVVYTYS